MSKGIDLRLIAIAVMVTLTVPAVGYGARNSRHSSRKTKPTVTKQVETPTPESAKTDTAGSAAAAAAGQVPSVVVPSAEAEKVVTVPPADAVAPNPAGVTVVQPEASGECRAPFPFTKKYTRMQRVLERRLRASGLGRYLDKKQLGVALVDLSVQGRAFYAGINDNDMMYAASLPKIAILVSVIKAVNEGKLEWTHEYEERLSNMIRASSNTDASWGAEMAGLEGIESTMRDPEYCFYDNKSGGLWVGRQYGPRGGTNRDPLQNLSHAATARQTARFYTMLDEGLLVSKHWSFRMLGLMSPPAHHHKFVGGLEGTPGVTFLARKSGSWRHWHSDSALIQHHGRRYVAVGISETSKGEKLMQQLIKVLDDIVMDGDYRPRRDNRQASLP
ncbi:MAG: serine hydrolase [Myxococcota bacterium]|nr:serine hydrolase [Myxococcota bacterium]